MKKHIKMAAAAAATLICAGPLAAFNPANEEFIPAGDIIGMININDSKGMWASFGQSQLVKEIEDVLELPAFREGSDFEEFLAITAKAEGALGYEMTPKVLLGEKLNQADIYYLSEEGRFDPSGVLVLDFVEQSDAKNFHQYMVTTRNEELAQGAVEGQPTASLVDNDVHGVQITSDIENGLYYGTKGNSFLLALTSSAIDSALSPSGKSGLETADGLQNKSKLGEAKGEVTFYFDLAKMTGMAKGISGLDVNTSSGTTVGVIDFSPGKVQTSYYYQPSEKDELLQQAYNTTATTNTDMLKYLPADTDILFTTNMLLSDLAQKIWDRGLENGGPEAGELMMMEGAAQQNGLSIREDVLGAFGPQAAVSIKTPSGAGMGLAIPGASIITKVADAEKAAKLKAQFETALIKQVTQQVRQYNPNAPEGKFESELYAGVELRTIQIANPMMPMEVSHATTADGYFVLGLGKASVKTALDTPSNGKSIAASTIWREVSASHEGKFNYLAVIDAKSISDFARGIAPMFMSLGGGGSQEDITNLNEMLDVIASIGKVYNMNKYDGEGLYGDSYYLIP